jgi:hypothetical protein
MTSQHLSNEISNVSSNDFLLSQSEMKSKLKMCTTSFQNL